MRIPLVWRLQSWWWWRHHGDEVVGEYLVDDEAMGYYDRPAPDR